MNENVAAERQPVTRLELALLLFFITMVMMARIWHLPHYPFHEDELGSIVVMESIVKTGLPLTETGHLYWRAVPAHYLMALPLFFMKTNEYSTRLVSTLAGGGVLLVAYLMTKRCGGRLAALLAIGFLSVSAYELNQGAFARFYMLFQLAFLCAVYFAARYFIDGERATFKWLVVAICAALFTHELAVELLPVLFLALLIGGRYSLLKGREVLVGTLITAVVATLVFVYRPPNIFVNHVAIPLVAGAIRDKFFFYKSFLDLLPLGMSLIAASLVLVWQARNKIWSYYLLAFLLCLAGVSLGAPGAVLRYMGNLFPLAVILAALGAARFVTLIRQVMSAQQGGYLTRLTVLVLALAVLATHAVAAGDWRFGNAVGNKLTSLDQRPPNEYIGMNFREGDVIVSMDPLMTKLYTGHGADYFIREKFDETRQRYIPYSNLEKSTFAYPIIDDPGQLHALVAQAEKRIWFYANYKFTFTLSPLMQRIVRENFRVAYFHGNGAVYLREPQQR